MKSLIMTAFFGFFVGLSYILLSPLSISGERVFHYQWPIELAEHKHTLYQDKTYNQPSIVLVGGSNLLYGVDSEKLSSLVNRPVFNYGLGVILGLDHILDLVDPHIRRGDTVLLFLENEILSNGELTYSGSIVNGLLDSNRLSEHSLIEKVKLLWHAPFSTITGKLNSNKGELFNTMYHSSSLNTHGDIKSQLINENPPVYPFPQKAMTPVYPLHKNSQKTLYQKVVKWRDRGVRLFAIPPPRYANKSPSMAYHDNEVAISSMYDDLGITYLSHYTRHEFSADYIHDSINHINLKARAINTQRIAESVIPVL